MNDFSGPWGIVMVSGCLVSGPENFYLLEFQSQIEEVAQSKGPGLVGLHVKGRLTEE